MSKSLIFAHRGANTEAAENTRTAFECSLSHEIDGIETDVQLSRDQIAVLWHDRFLNKLGLPDKRIDDFDFATLREMNFSAHFPGAKPEGILSLSEFFEAYRRRCHLLIEIKNREWESRSRHQVKVRQTLELAGEAQGDRVIVSSFNLDSLVYAHQCAPSFPLVYNFEPEQTFADAQRVLGEHGYLHGLCLPIVSLNETIVRLLRGYGKSIAVYTCNSEVEISCALTLGVDILISDVPQKALQMRNEMVTKE